MMFLLFSAGLALLIIGAELLVRGASRFAAAIGISPLIIGLTVVAFGTSSPELAVSFKAAIGGQAGIALGNVIGSNIFNILFILGLTALVTPLLVKQQLIRLDVPFMIAASTLLYFMGLNGKVSRPEGLLLFMVLIAYLFFLIRQSRKEIKEVKNEYAGQYGELKGGKGGHFADSLLIICGLAFLFLGSGWLVDGAVSMGRYLGVSELVMGLTVLSVGTSLPETVTSIVAGLRGERDIAVGNVVGSNLFNIMGVLGLAALAAPGGVEVKAEAIRFDMPVMLAAAVACLPVFFTGNLIARWEGGLFLAYYVAYVLYLVLSATGNITLPLFRVAMVYFVAPLTMLTLFILFFRALADIRKKGHIYWGKIK